MSVLKIKDNGTWYNISTMNVVKESNSIYLTTVPISATTGDIASIIDSRITSESAVAEVTFANPSAITSDVTWTTGNGLLVLNGTCTSATTANIVIVHVLTASSSQGSSADSVIEEGTSGDWTYRKWDSGIAEAWCRKTATKTGVSKTAPWSGYEYDFGVINYPSSLFLETLIPVAVVNGSVGSNYRVVSYARTYNTGVSCALQSNSSGSQSCEINIYAIGRWKT